MIASAQEWKDHLIIHTGAAFAALVAAASPLPAGDAVLIMPIQMGMTAALAASRGLSLPENLLESAGVAVAGQVLGRGGVGLLALMMPGVGTLGRAGVAASVTEALGWAVVHKYDRAPEALATPV